MQKNYYTTLELAAIKSDYANGMPRSEIYEKYNLTKNQLDGICSKHGARRRIKPKPKPKYPNRLYTLVSDDEAELPLTPYVNTVVELSKITGINLETLYGAITRGRRVRYHSVSSRKVKYAKILKMEVEN